MRRLSIAIAIALVATAAQGGARERGVVQTFLGFCVQNMPYLDRVEAMANSLGFQELSGDAARAAGPLDPSAAATMWIGTTAEGEPVLVGISEAELEGKQYKICSVADPEVDVETLISTLEGIIDLGALVSDETEAGQRYRAWALSLNSGEAFVTSTDAARMGIPGANLGITMVLE